MQTLYEIMRDVNVHISTAMIHWHKAESAFNDGNREVEALEQAETKKGCTHAILKLQEAMEHVQSHIDTASRASDADEQGATR